MILSILKMGGIGSLIFTCFILLMSKSGIASAIRDEEGNFIKKLNWRSIAGGIAFEGFLFGLLFLGNIHYTNSTPDDPGFFQFCLHSFGTFFMVHLYDLIIIDFLTVIKWHPGFLKLPDSEYYNTIHPHVIGFLRGIPIGMVASILVSIVSLFLL
jgi:hypothetical protein